MVYDIDGNVIAYYISFKPNGYAIVNNNLDNPIAIEFGEGDNVSIRNIIEESSLERTSPEICYADPGYSFMKDQLLTNEIAYSKEQIGEVLELDSLYQTLSLKNDVEKTLHQERRTYAIESSSTRGGSYDFIDWDNMPSGSYSSGYIPFGGTTWAVMSDYDSIATNHCGATAATNISLYYANRGYSNLKKNNSVDDTFKDLHNRIGNGPAMTIASDVKAYASSRGYTMKSSDVPSYSSLKTATSNNRACGILLTAAPLNWHWVVSSGWRQYDSGNNYVRVVNGWENSANNFYLFNSGMTWSMTQYWIE